MDINKDRAKRNDEKLDQISGGDHAVYGGVGYDAGNGTVQNGYNVGGVVDDAAAANEGTVQNRYTIQN